MRVTVWSVQHNRDNVAPAGVRRQDGSDDVFSRLWCFILPRSSRRAAGSEQVRFVGLSTGSCPRQRVG